MATGEVLPSWRPGPARHAILEFLEASCRWPVAERLAVFDNDGTLWCERPTYAQYDYFVDAVRRRVGAHPGQCIRPEYAAVLDDEMTAVGEVGLARLAAAFAELFAGMIPEAFAADVTTFFATARHRRLDRPLASAVYQPMQELLAALRGVGFTIAIATGGGVEFVRAVSRQLYGVPPELVVGTQIGYNVEVDGRGHPHLVRGRQIVGGANEGLAKPASIQSSLGRRPVFAAGNTMGDREMLDWAMAGDGPRLALLIDHDDEDREYAYAGTAATIADAEPLAAVAERGGWTTASMARDWATIFSA